MEVLNKKLLGLFIPTVLLAFTPTTFAEKQWELIWSDEFEQPGLPDESKWGYEKGYVRNGEKQFYTESDLKNARVEDGHLIIEAHKVQQGTAVVGAPADKQVKYTAASLTTKNIAEWKYGRVEVRAKLAQGRGVWPAIWLLGTDDHKGWPRKGEIDIMEYVGYQPNRIHSAIHTMKNNHRNKNTVGGKLDLNDLDTAFHVYAVDRYADRLDFWIDDNLHFSYEKESDDVDSWPFDDDMYLILNLAIGGGWGGKKGIDDSIFPQQFKIDYVRVYR